MSAKKEMAHAVAPHPLDCGWAGVGGLCPTEREKIASRSGGWVSRWASWSCVSCRMLAHDYDSWASSEVLESVVSWLVSRLHCGVGETGCQVCVSTPPLGGLLMAAVLTGIVRSMREVE